MIGPLKNQVRQAAGELLFRAGVRPTQRGALGILMYHAVTKAPLRDTMQMSISADLFASHMAQLRSLDVDIVSLKDGLTRLAGDESHRLAVSVVFDDGFVGVHDHALGTLQAYRIPSTVFVTTGAVGRPAFSDCDSSLGRPLTWRELATLATDGACTIGSHGHDHRVFAHLTAVEKMDELRRSRDLIAAHIGYSPRQFAYPFGSFKTFNSHSREALAAEQFDLACTTVWGWNPLGADPLELKRFRMSWCDSPHELRKSLAGCYEWYRLVQRAQACIVRGL